VLSVLRQVPFVDVVAAMSDPELPLTTQEYSEWGNPADAHMKQYMMSYSPYDTIPLGVVPPSLLVFSTWLCVLLSPRTCCRHVRDGRRLVAGGASDPRVPIWQPLRFMSRLRWRCDDLACADKGVLLGVQVDASGGHFGAAGASARASEDALEFAFLHRALQLEPFRAAGV
jgi:oligopeptidase B